MCICLLECCMTVKLHLLIMLLELGRYEGVIMNGRKMGARYRTLYVRHTHPARELQSVFSENISVLLTVLLCCLRSTPCISPHQKFPSFLGSWPCWVQGSQSVHCAEINTNTGWIGLRFSINHCRVYRTNTVISECSVQRHNDSVNESKHITSC